MPPTDDHFWDGNLRSAIAGLSRLIAFDSVSSSSNDAISEWVSAQLAALGFSVTASRYVDASGTGKTNLVACRLPPNDSSSAALAQGGLAYFCHTDVVPADRWVGAPGDSHPDPFSAKVTDDKVYGRGACDMKGSLAAMLAATARVSREEQTRPIWIVCTADEEVGFQGAKHIAHTCDAYRSLVRAAPICLIGEPTDLEVVYAHKGIRGFKISSTGHAAHSATNKGINANEAMVPMLVRLQELCQQTRRDASLCDSRFDPPTLSWNFGFSDHMNVVNVTPGRCDAWVSLRPMPGIDGDELIDQAEQLASQLGLTVERMEGCGPLWTEPDSECVTTLCALAGTQARTVCYATDGGVLDELARRVVIGPGSIEQAHTVDEWITIDQLSKGIEVYEKSLRHWCVQPDRTDRSDPTD